MNLKQLQTNKVKSISERPSKREMRQLEGKYCILTCCHQMVMKDGIVLMEMFLLETNIFIMHLLEDYLTDQLHQQSCQCSACLFKTIPPTIALPSDIHRPNSFHTLLKMLPTNFPMVIEQTILLKQHPQTAPELHSFNNNLRQSRKKWNIVKYQMKSINSLMSQNLQIYFESGDKLITRQEVMLMFSTIKSQKIQFQDKVLYIQPYQPRPIIRSTYDHQKQLKDSLLVEYLVKEETKLKNPSYQPNEEMLEWVYREYGQNIFCQYLGQLYVRTFKTYTQHTIRSAIFYWVFQPLQSRYSSPAHRHKTQYDDLKSLGKPRSLPFKPKLVNIKSLQVKLYQTYYSFEDEFSDKIKQKLMLVPSKQSLPSKIKLTESKLHNVYDEQQAQTLSKIQEEKQFEYQHDTQKMAQMLVPSLYPYKSLRQVVNDETAFKHVFGRRPRGKTQMRQTLTKTMIKKPVKIVSHMSPVKSQQKVRSKGSQLMYETIKKKYQKILNTPSTAQGVI